MNKLEVALKLLQLLNERKAVDSKTVAHEFNVSLRTAQRYLMELSMLPCVRGNGHSYCLVPDYQLNQAIKRPGNDTLKKIHLVNKLELDKHVCERCGKSRGFLDMVDLNHFSPVRNVSNLVKVDRLTALITKRLLARRCSFP